MHRSQFPGVGIQPRPRRRILSGIFLGNLVDTEPDGQPSAAATGDDAGGSDDEDGVIFVMPLLVGQTATIQVIASTNGLLNAWFDCDHNGSWTGPGEQFLTNAPLVAGTNTLQLAVPAHTAPGPAPARFRFNTTGGLAPTGLAADGDLFHHHPDHFAGWLDRISPRGARPLPGIAGRQFRHRRVA